MPQVPTNPQGGGGLEDILQSISPLLGGGFLGAAAQGSPMGLLGMVPGQLFGQGPGSFANPGFMSLGGLMQPAGQQTEQENAVPGLQGFKPAQPARRLGPLAGILPMLAGGGRV